MANSKEKIEKLFETAGRWLYRNSIKVLLITSLVLSTGFFILMFASLNHLIRFGFFTGITILIALLADFLLLPAMMVLIKRRRQKVPQLI
jgi:predicted RND superfamily exporter protein